MTRSWHQRRLYSLMSAWTSRDFRIARKFATTSWYTAAGDSNATSRREGAGVLSSPIYAMTNTLSRTRHGVGTRTLASSMRTRVVYSFWAHAKIVGFVARFTRLNRGSASMYRAMFRKVAVLMR